MSDENSLPVSEERAAGTPLRELVLVMVLIIAPLIALSQFIAYWRIDVVDDQMFGYFGWRIANGATVYLDVWDNKPPGIYWINAIGMLVVGGSYFGVIAMCAAAMVAAHVAFFVTAASVYHRSAAALTTILLSFYLTHAFYTGGTNRTETFLVAFELAAVALYMRGWARDRWWTWYVAGGLCGAAFLFKQVGLAAWGCMGLHTIIMVLAGRLALGTGAKRCFLLLGGAVTTILLAAGYLASQGALQAAYYAAFAFNREYFAHGSSQFPFRYVSWKLLEQHVHPILLLPLLMAAAATIHAVLWWARPRFRPPEIEQPLSAVRPVCPGYFLLFALWFVVAFWGALLSPHGFRHYLVPAIPPLLLLAGYLINVLRAETKLLRRLQQRAWVAVAVVVMGYFAAESVQLQFQEVSKVLVFRFDQKEQARWEVVGRAVRDITDPGDTIQCLGYMPGTYLVARRPNVSRYATTEKIGQLYENPVAERIARELEDALYADPPVLLVMSADDYFKLYGRKEDKNWPTGPQFARWIDERYRLVAEVPRFGTIYLFKRADRLGPNDKNLSDRLEGIVPQGARSQGRSKPYLEER